MGKIKILCRYAASQSAALSEWATIGEDALAETKRKEMEASFEIAEHFDNQMQAQSKEIERLRDELRCYKNQLKKVVDDREELLARIAELDRLTTGKERANQAPSVSFVEKYRYLNMGERVVAGDQLYCYPDGWVSIASGGNFATETNQYRRKVSNA